MMRLFTSDLHIGHRFVAGLRGFDNVAEHDEAIRDRWRSVVRDGDDVWVLGDLSMTPRQEVFEFIRSLPGRKHLIAGNHDACHPMHRDAHKWQRRYLEAFGSVQAFARVRIGGEPVLMSHFPYRNDRGEARYNQYRLRDEGMWLLHGHTHLPDRVTGPIEIHVGVDAWDLTPVPEDRIIELKDRIIELKGK